MSFREFMELRKDTGDMLSTTADQLGISPKNMRHIVSTTPDVMGIWGLKNGLAKNLSAYVADLDDEDENDGEDFPKTTKLKQLNGLGASERNYKMDKKGRMVRMPRKAKFDNDTQTVKTDDFIGLYKKGLQPTNAGGVGGGGMNAMLPGQI